MKDNARVVNATQKHIDIMKPNLRIEDMKNCWEIFKISAKESLQVSFNRSKLCWVALLNEKPIFAFGVFKASILSEKGMPWLIGTNDILKVKFRLLKQSKKYVKKMFTYDDFLEGYVHGQNKISYNWLKWCGFHMGEKKPFGPKNILCHKFWLSKEEIIK